MALAETLKMYGRYLRDLPAFYRQKMTVRDARERIRKELDHREDTFLMLMERGVYGYPKSPYLALLKAAGVELGDLHVLVRSSGVETALEKLRDEGVYVTFDEFKGRVPIIRNGKIISNGEHAFDNPYLIAFSYHQSSGTTGTPTRSPSDLRNTLEAATGDLLMRDAHGIHDVPHAVWRGVHPDGTGVSRILRGVLYGRIPHVWYSQLNALDLRPSFLKFTLASWLPVFIARIMGFPVPFPRTLTADNPYPLLEWIKGKLADGGGCAVQSVVSRCLRVCVAARQRGVDLTGTTFVMGGEAPSPAKVKAIRRTGARTVPTYALAETGRLGIGCGTPAGSNDIHLLKNRFALIKHRRYVPGFDRAVDAFMLTTLAPTAPRILLNVEMDDCGVIEKCPCGCRIGEIGLTTHVRDIYSYRKLTTEGVTLVGSEAIYILEEVLPEKFGGSALDYQLVEEENNQGYTRLYLRVSPRIDLNGKADIIQTVMDKLQSGSCAGEQAMAIWKKARTLRLRRQEPVLTENGKFYPIRHLRRDLQTEDYAVQNIFLEAHGKR